MLENNKKVKWAKFPIESSIRDFEKIEGKNCQNISKNFN
jgi:hypothetical protein